MRNPVQVTDLEERWRPLSAQERIVAQARLNDAWALVSGRVPTLQGNLAANLVSEGNVVRLLCDIVLRHMQNPEGKFQESIDDYSFQRDRSTSDGRIYVTDEELASLRPVGSRVRSVRLVAYGES